MGAGDAEPNGVSAVTPQCPRGHGRSPRDLDKTGPLVSVSVPGRMLGPCAPNAEGLSVFAGENPTP